ncbi:MAG: cpaB, partial [Oscillospiraceae bacterium]|nr:cpaB [Oscillospiraceae bacterium]
ILAGISMFLYNIAVKSEAEKVQIIKVSKTIQKGQQISKDMVKTEEVALYGLEKNTLKNPDEAIGKYALADFSPGDVILSEKVAQELPSVNEKLLTLDGKKVAISVSIKSFAKGLSDKLQAGDIISVYASQNNKMITPPELRYVEVLTTTNEDGIDKQSDEKLENNKLSTVTFLASPKQAEVLAQYENDGNMHMALVYRGNKETAKKFLDAQNKVLKGE